MKWLTLLLAPALLLSSCKRETPEPVKPVTTTSDTPGPEMTISNFPLKVGNIWAYDSGDTIKAVADTVINGMAAVKLLKITVMGTIVSFYSNQPDGLYLLATDSKLNWLAPGYNFKDSFKIFAIPILQVKYNTAIKNPWHSHDSTYPRPDDRQWLNYVTVSTKTGKFNCVRMATEVGHFTEYYSDKGLIKIAVQMACVTAPCPPFVTKLVYVNF